jgi:hypothetical protein
MKVAKARARFSLFYSYVQTHVIYCVFDSKVENTYLK